MAVVAFTVLPYIITGLVGLLYLAAALALGVAFIGFGAHLALRPSRAAAIRLHLASLGCLARLLAARGADRLA